LFAEEVRSAEPVKAARRPNVLFILVDDESPFDLKVYAPASTDAES
jgi:choline-sulfatase